MRELQGYGPTIVALKGTMLVLEARLRSTSPMDRVRLRAHLKFIRSLIGKLGELEHRAGNDWGHIAPQLFSRMSDLIGATDARQFVARSEGLHRELMGMPLANDVRRMLGVGHAESDPGTRFDRTKFRNVISSPPTVPRSSERGTGSVPYAGTYAKTTTEPPVKPPRKGTPTFHFALKGKKASGSHMAAGSTAQLHFMYAVPGADAIAAIRSAALSTARQDNVDIRLIVTAKGQVRLDGNVSAIAHFENGALAAPVVFKLIAEKDPGSATLKVDYLVRGELVYHSEMHLTVVNTPMMRATDDKTGEETKRLPANFLAQVGAAAAAAPAQRIHLTLFWQNNSLAIYLVDSRDGVDDHKFMYDSAGFGPVLIEFLQNAIHNDLGSTYQHEDAWRDFHGTAAGDDPQTGAALAHAMEAVAVAGCRLDSALRQYANLAKVLDYIETHAQPGCVLSVSTDDIFLPWELLYPLHRSPNMTSEEKLADPVRPERFWGARFAIATEMPSEGSLIGRRDEHLRHGPKVSMNLNPQIRANAALPASEPHEIHRNWLEKHKNNPALAGVQDSCTAIRSVLRSPQQVASLIYLYCHGSAPDITRGKQATLQLDGAECKIEPQDIAKQPKFKGSPIIFLNSCRGGVSSPLVFNHFLQEFQNRGALGMIGTTFAVPVVFGASFGLEVIEGYIKRSGSLSAEMLRLRRLHLDKGNPVPLFYSLQCHLDLPFTPKATP